MSWRPRRSALAGGLVGIGLSAAAIGLGACAPPAEADTSAADPITVQLEPTAMGTPADPTLFDAASAAHPKAVPDAGWDTLWTALSETPMGLDWMTRTGPFPPAVAALNETDVTITGYMMPLDASTAPTRFLLVGVPLADCAFCIPNGPAGAIEVLAREGVPGTYDPVTLQGRFHVLDADPNGLLFRLTDAALQ
ncbi:MAG: DUF3299 domain-containing protein [Bacteroidota bacterium]